MKLTEKAKEQFEKWYNSNVAVENEEVKSFLRLPEPMQWGVIQDFADSLGYDMATAEHMNAYMFLITHKKRIWEEMFDFKTRQEARNAAIEKLNEKCNDILEAI